MLLSQYVKQARSFVRLITCTKIYLHSTAFDTCYSCRCNCCCYCCSCNSCDVFRPVHTRSLPASLKQQQKWKQKIVGVRLCGEISSIHRRTNWNSLTSSGLVTPDMSRARKLFSSGPVDGDRQRTPFLTVRGQKGCRLNNNVGLKWTLFYYVSFDISVQIHGLYRMVR